MQPSVVESFYIVTPIIISVMYYSLWNLFCHDIISIIILYNYCEVFLCISHYCCTCIPCVSPWFEFLLWHHKKTHKKRHLSNNYYPILKGMENSTAKLHYYNNGWLWDWSEQAHVQWSWQCVWVCLMWIQDWNSPADTPL